MSGANDDTSQVRNAAGRLRALMGELKLPKEIANHILSQIDETKHAALAVIAKETRLFLEKTNIGDELAKALTQVAFEIRTEVRFVPNDKATGVVPKVKISGPRFKKAGPGAEDGTGEKDGTTEGDPESSPT